MSDRPPYDVVLQGMQSDTSITLSTERVALPSFRQKPTGKKGQTQMQNIISIKVIDWTIHVG